jgi:adenylate cyclase
MIRSVGNSTATPRTTTAPRRTVSVVFIDIVGFTALVDQMDPEDVWALQKDYFAVVSRIVRAGGGVVEKYIGDAVMAVFASPEHADTIDGIAGDAARAVRAGLRMQEALLDYPLAGRFPVQTRVGVATGPAIVDLQAAGNGGQAMISGSVVATASRLQAFAPHGTVVVCAVTRQVTDALIAYQDLPPVAVAGKPYPLDLWRALAPQGLPVPEIPVLTSAGRADRRDTAGLPRRTDAVFVVARGDAVHARAGPAAAPDGEASVTAFRT